MPKILYLYLQIGDSAEDIEARRKIISKFYHDWKLRNQSLRRFNLSLNEYINIRFVSITETCTHASRSYLSTLAVLQLDAILTNARIVSTVKSKENGNQKPFEKMIIMKKAATNDVTAIYLPRGNVLELLLESGHRWRGFLHVRKPIRHTFYFLMCKGMVFL